MTLAEVTRKIEETSATLKLLKKLRRTIEKAEQITVDLSNSK